MSKQQIIPYNQIDFVIKAPRFQIVFSYMNDKNIAFIREYLLRLLQITPCKPEQIAKYFGFSQHETEVALSDLQNNKWVVWQSNGAITLSSEGLRLFQPGHSTPQIPTLQEYGGEYRMELLDNNFLLKKDIDNIRHQALELPIEVRVLSESKGIAQKVFQNRFRQLLEDNIIDIDESDITLYKIDTIETKGAPVYFRFTQKFELLPETGDVKERHDIPILIHQSNIQRAITHQIEQFNNRDNLNDLKMSMEELKDSDTPKVLFGGKLDFTEFSKIHNEYEQRNNLYFLGQIYHQEHLFTEIINILNKLEKPSGNEKLCWIAPSDIYWGKQRKIHDKIQLLIDKQNGYEFRLYLPLPSERNNREKQEWKNEFRDINKKVLYGFDEDFLNGNTEFLFLKNKFAIVCYHAKLPTYPVTLPIGFMITQKKEIESIVRLVENYLNSKLPSNPNEYKTKDLGLLHK